MSAVEPVKAAHRSQHGQSAVIDWCFRSINSQRYTGIVWRRQLYCFRDAQLFPVKHGCCWL